MNKILKKWQFSLLVVPLISVSIIYVEYKTLYPLLTYDVFPFKFPSLTTIKLIAILNVVVIPFLVSRIYKFRLPVPVIFWAICTALALFLERGIYEGNANWGLAFGVFPFQLLAILLTTALVARETMKATFV